MFIHDCFCKCRAQKKRREDRAQQHGQDHGYGHVIRLRRRDRRLIILDGALITGTQLRFRVACARVLDAAAAFFCLAFRASALPFVGRVRVARAPRVRFDDGSIGESALIGVADAFATMSRLTS